MSAKDRSILFATLLLKEYLRRFAAEVRGNFTQGDSDDYYHFLRSESDSGPTTRGYPYFLACKAILDGAAFG